MSYFERMSTNALSPEALATLFTEARTHSFYRDEPVPDALLRRIWDVARMGPTAMNMGSLRVAFVRTEEARQKLLPAVAAGNVDKVKGAKVTAIFAYDLDFHEKLPKLFAHSPGARERFADQSEEARAVPARTNALLGAAYFMMAARAHGLDCGPMGGFDAKKVDEDFFAGTKLRSLFLCNLGYGDASKLFPRQPRLEFEEACTLL